MSQRTMKTVFQTLYMLEILTAGAIHNHRILLSVKRLLLQSSHISLVNMRTRMKKMKFGLKDQ